MAPVNSVTQQKLINELQSIVADYKAPIIAAEIIDNGVDIDSIYFRNISIFQRFVSRDVESIDWGREEYELDQLIFELNREGLYDMIPRSLVHTNSELTSDKAAVEEFNLQREQERQARKFFGTFENEFHHSALRLEIQERELFSNNNHATNRAFFERFFGDSSHLTDIQVLTLLHVLPLSSRVRGDVKLISATLTKILGYTIKVERKAKKRKMSVVHEQLPGLGSTSLGVDSILADYCDVCTFYYDAVVHDIPVELYSDFIIKGENYNVLQFVLPFLFPADTDINIILSTSESCKKMKTSYKEELCFLGFNSYI